MPVKSDLPFGSEFSPSQISLSELLVFAHDYGGDWRKFELMVRTTYFEENDTSDYNKGKLANNTKLGMIAYGLIERDASLTEFGWELYEIREDYPVLVENLARHILLHLNGLVLVECVRDIQASGERVTLTKLRSWLEERGIHFPRGGKHPSIMRLWLEEAGVFVSGWHLNELRINEIIGIEEQEIDALGGFTTQQRVFLRTLANLGTDGWHPSNDIEKLATATYGVTFNEKNLPKDVLYPLEESGYIILERGTKMAGRGAKPFLVTPTDQMVEEIIVPILNQIEEQIRRDIRPLLRKSFGEVLEELDSNDTHIKGLALEALAFKLLRLIDLRYVATRARGISTGGAEIDLIFESTRLVFSRWQVQCKHTSNVSVEDVAKEVGLSHVLKSNVIVIVCTGQIGPDARRYANIIMQTTNLAIVMIAREDIEVIKTTPPAIVDIFNREARHAMKLKQLEI